MITITGPLKIWTGSEGSSHFISVPDEVSGEIRLHALSSPRGFGSVRVEVTMDQITWRTSVFPVKIEVVRKADIAAGDEVTARLELL